MHATFIGHQTWLIEHNNTKILIDPLLCTNFGLTDNYRIDIYPPRKVDASALYDLDVIFLSHEHSDHFDIESLNLLPRTATFYVGVTVVEPVKKCIRDLGFKLVEVFDSNPIVHNDIRIRFYPADPRTAFWESRVLQIHLEEKEDKSNGIFIAVDALVSDVFKDEVKSGLINDPKLVIISNNSRTSPPGAFQSLENWGKNDSSKKIGPLGVGVLTSVLTSYLDDFPTKPENIAICGGGFVKRFDGFAAFPFSEQAELSRLANALSLDVNIVGLKPGEVFHLQPTPGNKRATDWVSIDKVQHELLTKELEDFIKLKKSVDLVESVMADYVNESEYKSALLLAEQELKKITKSLLLFITGKKAIAIKDFKGRKIKARRLVFVFRSDSLGLRSAYSLNFLNGKFELESQSEESYLTENYPFGVELPLVDFIGMVAGELQIWDIVGVSIKSWFEGGIFDGIIPFFYSYYGENGSPELLGKIIERKLRTMELSS